MCNLALSCAHVRCKEKVPAPGKTVGVDLMPAAGVRLVGAKLPLPCAVSSWSKGVPVQLQEQGKGVSASRHMCQEQYGPPKADTASTSRGVS